MGYIDEMETGIMAICEFKGVGFSEIGGLLRGVRAMRIVASWPASPEKTGAVESGCKFARKDSLDWNVLLRHTCSLS